MVTELQLRCVNCGEPAEALYKTYGSVLKLSKCLKCKGIVDKYIEYDPVIVMIDLVLMSKEAQRHVIYNTEFKSYWKLFIVLLMLETYGLWHSDSLLSIAVHTLCGIQTDSTVNTTYLHLPYPVSLPGPLQQYCPGWQPEPRGLQNDLFIWEKNFYIQFIATFAGTAAFIMTYHLSMLFLKSKSNKVPLTLVLKSFSLANMSLLLTLPMLVWGATAAAGSRAVHYALVFTYSYVLFCSVFTVLYSCRTTVASAALAPAFLVKFLATFRCTPLLREYLT